MKLAKILSQYNIDSAPEGHHHSRVGWIQIDCPFCGKDSKKWHLGYNKEDNYFNCWQCGYHSLVSVLMELTGLSFKKCMRLFGDLELTTTIKKEKVRGKLILPKGIAKLQTVHIRYLRQRGFDYKEIQKLWKIQGIGLAKQLAWRIFIPIIYRGKIVSWTTRSLSLTGKAVRYVSAGLEEESIPHKSLLYGEDYAGHSIIINEGPLDAWAIGPGAVATLGTGYTQAQINRMVNYPVRVVCFDSERESQKRARKLCDDLSVFPGETFNIVLDKKDAGETSKKDIRKIRKRFLE